jgi:hypothetical protein
VLLIVIDSVIWAVVSQAANGASRSHFAGIRLPSLMRSEDAWHAGHVVARKVMAPFLVAAAAIAVLSVPLQLAPVAYIAALGLSLVSTVLALGVGAACASRAARRLAP